MPIEEMQNDQIAQITELEPRCRMIMLTIPLCQRFTMIDGSTASDSEGWPIYRDNGDEYRNNVVEYLHTVFKAIGVQNYAIGEEYGDDMTVSKEEAYRENGTLRVYRHLHAVFVKANNNPLTKRVMEDIKKRTNADVRTIKNPKSYTDVLNYVVKDVRYGMYKENTISKTPNEVTELITKYESKGIPKWAVTLLQQPESNRQIHVVLDKKGGAGKSFFSMYLWAKEQAFYINDCPDTRSIERSIVDRCRKLDKEGKPRPKIVIADLPRAKDIGEPIYWEAMERAINGLLTEDRYNTEQMLVDIRRAIMFCNTLPWDGRFDKNEGKWKLWPTLGALESHDRFTVWEIVDGELQGPYKYYTHDPNEEQGNKAEYEPLIAEVFDEGDNILMKYTSKAGAGLYWKKPTELRTSC